MKHEFYQNLKGKTVVIGGDHHSQSKVDLFEQHLRDMGLEVERIAFGEDNKDYIAQACAVAERVSNNPENYCGIVGCKNGFGVTTVTNKFHNVFAARCDTPQQALDARRVNYTNVMTFGADFVVPEEVREILENWLHTEFEINEKNTERLERLFLLMKKNNDD